MQASDDGQQFRTVKKFTIDRHNLGVGVGPVPLAPVVATFPATTARFFQLKFSADCELGDIRAFAGGARGKLRGESRCRRCVRIRIRSMIFTPGPRKPNRMSAGLTIKPEAVRDISKLMAADGTLHWDVPAGEWIVLRTAMTPTGTKNGPAPPEATGFEVDKMNRVAVAVALRRVCRQSAQSAAGGGTQVMEARRGRQL